jgi:mannose-6-phosphate isomerase-like protein (cupin superfamily)
MSGPPIPVDLTKSFLALGHDGKAVVRTGAGPPPRIDGFTIGAPRMRRNPPHGGEVHPDGDEILYLISGGLDVILEEADGDRKVTVKPGEAIVVPKGVWHRVELHEPSHLLFITPGPGGAHRPLPRR